MRVVSVVGARPQFVKLAPVAAQFQRRGIDHQIIHTGQHYDQNMSGAFFEDLDIPEPDVNLEVGSSSHGAQTGQMLAGIEPVLADLEPDWVLVYGDTNSTLAAAVAAVKIHLPLAHLEAGLRSFNRQMPEEHNRVLTDHAADLLLPPTDVALGHLRAEGLADRSIVVGDVMADICLLIAGRAAGIELPEQVPVDEPFALATIHRAENTDDGDHLAAIISGLAEQPIPVVLTAHPRLRARCEQFGIPLAAGSLRTVEPLAYPQMVATLQRARAVITDSGGLQKEAYLVGTPCTTLRTETEWTETVDAGWNRLDPSLESTAEWSSPAVPAEDQRLAYGAGDAARRVADALLSRTP